jgi:hypothetical protein
MTKDAPKFSLPDLNTLQNNKALQEFLNLGTETKTKEILNRQEQWKCTESQQKLFNDCVKIYGKSKQELFRHILIPALEKMKTGLTNKE